jgi:hypothetical protein
MKKGIYVIPAMLTIFALTMMGCPTDGGSTDKDGDGSLTPVLGSLADASYEVNTSENADLRITVTNEAKIKAGGGKLSYQWYKADDAASAGTKTGTDSRDYTPAVNAAGTTYYWVVVTNSKADQTAASNKAKIIIVVPTGDSAIEKITAANAAMPLWEFTLPGGASWADYEEFSIEYYVSKDSRIVEPDQNVRSRLYGAYLAGDFTTPDQGNTNGWGGFRMVNWNTNPMANEGRDGLNPNNDFIIDNSRGTAATFGSLFTAEGGAASKWFTVKYTTNEGIANDKAKVTLLDSGAVTAIYVGAGIFGPGGDSGDNSYEFYVKNPSLLHKSDPTKNIPGGIFMTGTTEKLFAGNLGSAKGGTDRGVVTVYEDVEGEIIISFDLANGTGTFPPVSIMEGESLSSKFPAAEPTRTDFKFLGWYDGDTKVSSTTVFAAKTTLTAKWESTVTVQTYTVNLTGQTTKNTTAWEPGGDNSGLVFSVGAGFNPNFYETVEIICKFYGPDGTTEVTDIPASNFQAKFHAAQVADANGAAISGSWWNFGQGAPANEGPEGGLKNTFAVSAAVKAAGLWGISIAPSNGTAFTANYIEVLSITFPVE